MRAIPAHAYDRIGVTYTDRRPDPRVAAHLARALGPTGPVVNVGAGAGSYEPVDRPVVAVEPSPVMIGQRPPAGAPCVRAGVVIYEAWRQNGFDGAPQAHP